LFSLKQRYAGCSPSDLFCLIVTSSRQEMNFTVAPFGLVLCFNGELAVIGVQMYTIVKL
jgi:hypothetical protein